MRLEPAVALVGGLDIDFLAILPACPRVGFGVELFRGKSQDLFTDVLAELNERWSLKRMMMNVISLATELLAPGDLIT